MKIVIGCDHAAFEMKEQVKSFLQSKKIEVLDVGCHSSERCDYPDYAKAAVTEILKNDCKGILLCGSGIGISIAANRYKKIRAALCRSTLDSEMSRKHNDANVICFGARQNNLDEISNMIDVFLSTAFEGGRHADRVQKIDQAGESL